MNMFMTIGKRTRQAARGIVSLFRDRRGIAAAEFALIAPLLLALYFVSMEVSQGVEINRKVSRTGSMVADLVTQQFRDVSREDLEAIMEIGGAILHPYNRSQPTIIVTAIKVTDEKSPKAKVEWSRKMMNGAFSRPLTKNTTVTLPEELMIRDTFLIRVSSELEYRPVIAWTAKQKTTIGLAAAFDKIEMQETYYLRPRMTDEIACTGC